MALAVSRTLVLALALVAAAPTARAAVPPPASGALPDSVLAVVGGRRLVTVSEFRHAWSEVSPPARPDSLTPESARRFLQLLIGKELLAEAAQRERWVWTRAESARYFSTRDRRMLQAALARPLAEARQALARPGEPEPGAEAVGIAARDRAVERLAAAYDTLALARIARDFAALPPPPRDSGVFAQLRALSRSPEVDPRDSLVVLAHTTAGEYRVRDLMSWWSSLNPIARPRVESAEQMADLVKNGIFERQLRRMAEAENLDRRPEIAAELAKLRELFAVTHYVDREVYQKLPMDSVTLRRFYDRDPAQYAIPTRLRVLRLVLETRADAERMALRLRDAVEAESLVAKSHRQRLGYAREISAESDSLMFRRGMAAGTGAVLGPDSLADGWSATRVLEVLPPRPRSFEAARALVENHWYGLEGERRMVELLARLRRGARVVIRERALARLTES